MHKLFSTNDVHPRDRFDYWHSIACKSIVEHESQPECATTFQAEIRSGVLGNMALVLFENAPMSATRTAQQTAGAPTDDLFVCQQLAGNLWLEQHDREATLGPGDMTLLDPMHPYDCKFLTSSRLLLLKVPRRAFEVRLGKARDMVAIPLRSTRPDSSLTAGFLRLLPEHAGRLSSHGEQAAGEHALDLFVVSLASAWNGETPRVSSARSIVLSNLHSAIDARLSDPALDADTVAGIAGVSIRYANAVLAEVDTSIMRLVQSKRLVRCRKAFEDPAQSHRSISEIAFGWGFSDMTHFARSFKKAFGVAPSEYRRALR
jgi:AraC-like DNA-binding protein